MGNVSNRDQWVVQERLRYVERCAWWRGTVNRNMLAEFFGMSLAQVSADLQAYQEMNPGALAYNLRKKRYEGVPEMRCVLHEPRLEEALAWLPGGVSATLPVDAGVSKSATGIVPSQVCVLALPKRKSVAAVSRRVFLATLHGERVEVRYLSVRGSEDAWRWIRPHALAHDGHRWHARAWCERNRDYRDFSLSRIPEAKWPEPAEEVVPKDADWDKWVTLKLRPHRGLAAEQRRAVELDFGMKSGECRITVRRAMEGYLRVRLQLPLKSGGKISPLLEEA